MSRPRTDLHVICMDGRKVGACTRCHRFYTLNSDNLSDEQRQDRSLVPAPRPDFKHTVRRVRSKKFRHERHDIGGWEIVCPLPMGKGASHNDLQSAGQSRLAPGPLSGFQINGKTAIIKQEMPHGHPNL